MRFTITSSIALLCLANSVFGAHLQHASSAAGLSSQISASKVSHSASASASHSVSVSASQTPSMMHGDLEKRNIIDFFRRLIDPKAEEEEEDNYISASPSASASPSMSASNSVSRSSVRVSASPSATPLANGSRGAFEKRDFKDLLAMLRGDSHVSVAMADSALPSASASASRSASARPSVSVADRQHRGGRGKRDAALASIGSKVSSKAASKSSARASASSASKKASVSASRHAKRALHSASASASKKASSSASASASKKSSVSHAKRGMSASASVSASAASVKASASASASHRAFATVIPAQVALMMEDTDQTLDDSLIDDEYISENSRDMPWIDDEVAEDEWKGYNYKEY